MEWNYGRDTLRNYNVKSRDKSSLVSIVLKNCVKVALPAKNTTLQTSRIRLRRSHIMKKKSASQSAFFNLRVLTGLFLVLTGVFLGSWALASSPRKRSRGIMQPPRPSTRSSLPGLTVLSFARLASTNRKTWGRSHHDLLRRRQREAHLPMLAKLPLCPGTVAPLAYGGADVDLITGADSITHPTQSETYTSANPDNPNQIVVTYNDSRDDRPIPSTTPERRYSSDGGTTFTRLNPSPNVKWPRDNILATRLLSTTHLLALSLQFSGSTRLAVDRASVPGRLLTVGVQPGPWRLRSQRQL